MEQHLGRKRPFRDRVPAEDPAEVPPGRYTHDKKFSARGVALSTRFDSPRVRILCIRLTKNGDLTRETHMNKLLACPILALAAFSAPAHSGLPAGQCAKQSPPHSVALVELYTSEGCSSCPPADRWLSQIAGKGYGTDQLVPLSLHVDYWDRLGWKDRFGHHRFSERQQHLANLSRSRAIYTPGIFLNLREFRGWDSALRFGDAVRRINARPANGDIRLEIAEATPAQLVIRANFRIKNRGAAKQPNAVIALYENKLATVVTAGENRGVTLEHDYVVREWIGPIELSSGAAEYEQGVTIDRTWNPKNLGVAAFIQDLATQDVLQATALSICN